MKKAANFFILNFLLLFHAAAAQQAGSLDSTFDFDGKVTTSVGSVEDRIFSMAIQPDGKIVVGGASNNGSDLDFAIARYNSDGTLDSTFSADGKVTTSLGSGHDGVRAIEIQTDGKIVAGGGAYNGTDPDFAVARYNSDGSIDSSFGINGIQITPLTGFDYAYSLIITPSGDIILSGTTYISNPDFAIVRYDSNGILDNSFNGDGIVITDIGGDDDIYASALQQDGKIVAGGNGGSGPTAGNFALARYDTLGNLDSSFDIDGWVTTDLGSTFDNILAIAIQQDGKIVAGGSVDFTGGGANHDFALARYNTDGSLDTTFNATGKVITPLGPKRDIISAIKIQPDGKILAAGCSENAVNYDFALARYDSTGVLDNTFGIGGIAKTDFSVSDDLAFSMALQADHKIVAAGETFSAGKWNFALARYISGLNVGIVNFSGSDNSLLVYPNPIKNQAVLKYILSEDENISINLYDLQGKCLTTFVKRAVKLKGDHSENLFFSDDLPAGYYILQIDNGKASQSIKIIKQ